MNTKVINGQEVEISNTAENFLSEGMGAGLSVKDFKGCNVEEQIKNMKNALNNEVTEEEENTWRNALTEIIGMANKMAYKIEVKKTVKDTAFFDLIGIEPLPSDSGADKLFTACAINEETDRIDYLAYGDTEEEAIENVNKKIAEDSEI